MIGHAGEKGQRDGELQVPPVSQKVPEQGQHAETQGESGLGRLSHDYPVLGRNQLRCYENG